MSTETKAIIYGGRRCGNTTRQVDEWVQQLFNGKRVVIKDHADRDGNHANEFAERIFLRRLRFEHGLQVGKNSALIFDHGHYELLPF